MWSVSYNYYNIQFDEKYSQRLDKAVVVNCLLGFEELVRTDHQTFVNAGGFPWFYLLLVETYDGNYSSSHIENQFVTLISIVSSKDEDQDQQLYINLFKRVAAKLNWRLYLEEDDDGNKNVEL